MNMFCVILRYYETTDGHFTERFAVRHIDAQTSDEAAESVLDTYCYMAIPGQGWCPDKFRSHGKLYVYCGGGSYSNTKFNTMLDRAILRRRERDKDKRIAELELELHKLRNN